MQQDLSHWHVLVVDDEPDNLGVMELVLKFHKAAVRTAASGLECLQLMTEEAPTLLLVDIQMPEMSGLELLEKIRENVDWQHIPVIAVTAHAMIGDSDRFTSAGFDGYIAKPITAITFVSEVQSMIGTKIKSV